MRKTRATFVTSYLALDKRGWESRSKLVIARFCFVLEDPGSIASSVSMCSRKPESPLGVHVRTPTASESVERDP